MFSDVLIAEMADDLDSDGRAMVTDAEGKRLLFTTTTKLDLEGNEVILAYEGRGVIFFQLDRPMNRFRLMANGFPEKVVDSISDMVNRMIHVLADRRRAEATRIA